MFVRQGGQHTCCCFYSKASTEQKKYNCANFPYNNSCLAINKSIWRSSNISISQPPTMVRKNGRSSVGITLLHVWRRFFMLTQCLFKKKLHQNSVGSLLRVHCWLGRLSPPPQTKMGNLFLQRNEQEKEEGEKKRARVCPPPHLHHITSHHRRFCVTANWTPRKQGGKGRGKKNAGYTQKIYAKL